jgi:hypothetical protein
VDAIHTWIYFGKAAQSRGKLFKDLIQDRVLKFQLVEAFTVAIFFDEISRRPVVVSRFLVHALSLLP